MCCARNANVSDGAASIHEFVAQIIGMCHAKQTDHITVAGRRAIQTVTDLCRRGYWHVMCCTAAIGPDELLALLTKLGRDLRVGDTRLGFEVPISSDHASSLRRVLLDNAFVPVRQQIGVERRLFADSQEPDAPALHAQLA
jgi:hypothetical protein